VLASLSALSQPRPTSEALARFEQLLAQHLVAELEKDPCPVRPGTPCLPGRYLLLESDYGPCETLARLAAEAGLGTGVFPWKSQMYINWDVRADVCSIQVKQGQAMPLERLPLAA